MKKYTVGMVRARLAEALDEAERGVPVVIERRGVRYTLAVASRKARRRRRKPIIETVDPAVGEGQWTWQWSPRGLRMGRRRQP
jgi:antitoxin (DNA-binding transcriptional repressor) of toxin-antitoxin stability system